MAVTTRFPSANETYPPADLGWDDPSNMHADDGANASSSVDSFTVGTRYKTFGFDAQIPETDSITMVRVILEWGTAGGDSLNFTAEIGGVEQAPHTDVGPRSYPYVATIDITGDRAWTRADLLDANFKVNVYAFVVATPIGIDYVKVEVTHDEPPPPNEPTTLGTFDPELIAKNWF